MKKTASEGYEAGCVNKKKWSLQQAEQNFAKVLGKFEGVNKAMHKKCVPIIWSAWVRAKYARTRPTARSRNDFTNRTGRNTTSSLSKYSPTKGSGTKSKRANRARSTEVHDDIKPAGKVIAKAIIPSLKATPEDNKKLRESNTYHKL